MQLEMKGERGAGSGLGRGELEEGSGLVGAGGGGPAQLQYRSCTAGGSPGALPHTFPAPSGSGANGRFWVSFSHLRGGTLKRETPCVPCELQLT